MDNISLTKDGLELLHKASSEKKCDNLNIILQVTGCKEQESINKRMIRCTINDTEFKCGVVIIPQAEQQIDDNDIVKVEQIFGQGNSASSNKAAALVVIKRISIVKKNSPVVHDIDSLANFSLKTVAAKTNNAPIQNNYNNNNNNNDMNTGGNYQNNQSSDYGNSNYNDADKKYMKINSLSSFTKEICIKARVTKKNEKKNYTTQAGKSGSVFSFNLMDEHGEEIPVSAFNHTCEKFYDKVEENMVYEISGGYIKINDKKFSTVKSEYKLFLDDKTEIKHLQDDGKINKVNFKFIKINELITVEQYSAVDVRAMVIEIGEKSQIRTKKMEDKDVRRIQIGDSSGYRIEVTIWGKKSDFNFDTNIVYGFKCLKVNNYKGKALNLGDESQIIELDDKDAMNEKMECNEFADNFKFLPMDKIEESAAQIYPVKSIKEVMDLLDTSDDEKTKFPLCKVKANIGLLNLSDRSFYVGCPDCKKKIAENDTECQYCRKTFERPAAYYSLSIRLKDHSGDFYADALGAVGKKVMGMECEEFRDIMLSGDEEKQKSLARTIESQTQWFVISPKLNLYNDIKRKRYSITRVLEIDSEKNAEFIIDGFMKMQQFN
jgi:replication factor A1